MGFGRGIDAEARKGAVLVGSGHAWQATSVAMLPTLEQIYFVVPQGTPPEVDLTMLDAAGREAHARRLVTEAAPTGLAARRSLVGDARDLLAQVLRRMLPGLAGVATTRLIFLDTPTLPPREPGLTLYVHVGKTPQALEMLRAIRRGDSVWDGDPDTLDGDGYVNLLVHPALAPGQALPLTAALHLLLVGGSDYGTYFAVAAFCQKHLGVRWLFPGELGTVVPGAWPSSQDSHVVNAFEEPAVRSRTLAAMSSNVTHTAAELDEVRAWQLRNRLRPHNDMAKLFQKVYATPPCGRPLRDDFTAAMLEIEERVPTDHMLHAFLSPYQSAYGAMMGPRCVSDAVTSYPDLRHREARADAAIDRYVGTQPRLHSQLGVLGDTVRFASAPHPCPSRVPLMCCPIHEAAPSEQPRLLQVLGDGTVQGNFRTALGENFSHIATPATGDFKRFIPRAFRQHLRGPSITFDNWHPCIFDRAPTPPGEPSPARAALAVDLATQVLLSAIGRLDRGRDLSLSVAFDDLDTWCQCDACVRVDDEGGPDNHLMMYQGELIAYQAPALEREARLPPGGTVFDARILEERLAYLQDSFGGMLGGRARFVWASPPNNPFFWMTFDQLAAHGCVWAKGYPRMRTRRVLTLLNAVCDDLGVALGQARRGEALRGTSMRLPAELPVPTPSEQPVLGFHAYAQYMAPPMGAAGLRGVGEHCHDFLMPYLTGVRDTLEYKQDEASPYEVDTLPSPTGALARMVAAPDQFNHERWSRIARRTGLYEYISSTGYVGPHLYSWRMLSAIRRGLRHHRLRGFISETAPAWGFDAPMLWELPQMLWDPGPLAITPFSRELVAQGVSRPTFSHATRAGALRMEFCRSAFGPAWEWMLAFFDLCEEAWAATRDDGVIYERNETESRPYPDRRLRSGASSGIYGDGYGGRGGKISTLDGFLEMPSNRPGNRIRLLRCWDFLNEARTFAERGLEEARGLGAARVSEAERVLERVQLFRRSFGLTLLIGLWYEPVYKAFKEVRRLRFDLVGMRQMYGVVDNVMYTTSQSQSSASGFSGQVSVLTGYSEQHPSDSRLNLPRRGIALGADIKQAFALQIRTRAGVNGLRSLRNQVHRYLALSLDNAATDRFPTFMARAGEVRGLSNVGLGLFASRASALADNAPFPRDGADIEGPHRLIGLGAFYLKQYIDWWNRIPRTGATPEEREDALSERIRLLTRSDLHPTPDPGFGWCFTGLREIAGCVAVHGFAEMVFEEMETRSGLLDNIARG